MAIENDMTSENTGSENIDGINLNSVLGNDIPVVEEQKNENKSTNEETLAGEKQNLDEEQKVAESNLENQDEQDSQNLSFDNEGNVVNENGEVIHKKGEFEVQKNEDGTIDIVLPEDSDIDIIRQNLNTNYGIELKDEQGESKQYENTHEGTAQMIKDAANLLAAQQEEQVFKQYPQAKNFLNHLMAGGNPADFFSLSQSYRNFEMPAESDDNKQHLSTVYKDLITANMRIAKGYDSLSKEGKALVDKEASDYFDFKVSQGKEREAATTAQKALAAYEAQQEQKLNDRNAAILKQQKEQEAAYWNNVKSIIDSGKIGNLNIPENDRESFWKYVHEPVTTDGLTQEILDASDPKNNEMNMQLALLRYLKFDIDKLVKMRVAEERVKELRTLGEKGKKLRVQGSLPIEKTSTDLAGITINNVLGNK